MPPSESLNTTGTAHSTLALTNLHTHSANGGQQPLHLLLNPLSRDSSHRNSPLSEPSFFDDAFVPPPPSNNNFLDTILNPVSQPTTSEAPSFHWPASPPPQRQRPRSPLLQSVSAPHPMPGQRRSSRTSRQGNGYVDLTGASDQPASPPLKRPSPMAGPSAKRLKRTEGSTSARRMEKTPEAIEEIDLCHDKGSMLHTLQKQRADAVKAQQKPEEKPTTFNTYTCVICMDTPTDFTVTSCGHLFCHECLMQALVAGENRAGPGEPRRSQCPVCRKHLNRNKNADIMPLLLMKGLASQPRKRKS